MTGIQDLALDTISISNRSVAFCLSVVKMQVAAQQCAGTDKISGFASSFVRVLIDYHSRTQLNDALIVSWEDAFNELLNCVSKQL